MKRLIFILLISLVFFISGCTESSNFQITQHDITTLKIGDTFDLGYKINGFDVVWTLEGHDDALILEDNTITAIKPGIATLKAHFNNDIMEYIYFVEFENIDIYGDTQVAVGNTINFTSNQKVNWKSNDESIAIINEEGMLLGLKEGLVTIFAISPFTEQISASKMIFVYDEVKDDEIEINNIIENYYKQLTHSNYKNLFKPIIEKVKGSVVGISAYSGDGKPYATGSGTIYKRNIILRDDKVIENGNVNEYNDDIKLFEYWVVTNRSLVSNSDKITIYYGNDEEIAAQLIAFDQNEDLAVIKFFSEKYFPTINFSNENVMHGELVISIGNPRGYQYFQSSNLGIVSYPLRYVSTDTDGDGVNDWDAEYIQYDAAFNTGNDGGPLINLKGEVVGINTVKHGSFFENIDNMAFAIPSNLTKQIIAILETGESSQRATLGITVYNVVNILDSPIDFPEVNIPEGINYGFYVVEVNEGMGKDAGILSGDIIISLNDVMLDSSQLLRRELNRHLVGSGEIAKLVVLREGKEEILILRY